MSSRKRGSGRRTVHLLSGTVWMVCMLAVNLLVQSTTLAGDDREPTPSDANPVMAACEADMKSGGSSLLDLTQRGLVTGRQWAEALTATPIPPAVVARGRPLDFVEGLAHFAVTAYADVFDPGDKEVGDLVSGLIGALGSTSIDVRIRAGVSLGTLGGPRLEDVVREARRMLQSSDSRDVAIAADMLSHLGPMAHDAVPALRALIGDPSAETRARVASALLHLGGTPEDLDAHEAVLRKAVGDAGLGDPEGDQMDWEVREARQCGSQAVFPVETEAGGGQGGASGIYASRVHTDSRRPAQRFVFVLRPDGRCENWIQDLSVFLHRRGRLNWSGTWSVATGGILVRRVEEEGQGQKTAEVALPLDAASGALGVGDNTFRRVKHYYDLVGENKAE